MKTSSPSVSIVIPVYNGERHIGEALASCLKQTHENLEIIMIDDCGTDHSIDIINQLIKNRPDLILCRHPCNQGVSAAWNTGLERAQGDWVLRLAQDDVLETFAVEELLKTAAKHPDTDVVYSDMWDVDENLANPILHPVTDDTELFKSGNKMGLCVMMSKNAVDSGLRYQSQYQAAEDLAYFTSLYDKGFKFKKADSSPLMLFRHHQDMGSVRLYTRQQLETAQILCKRTSDPKERRAIVGKYFTFASYYQRSQNHFMTGLQIAIRGLARTPFHCPLAKEALANIIRKKPST